MKAAIYKSYGSPEVMEIMDVEKPLIKDEDRVLIKVVSASVNKYDTLYRKGTEHPLYPKYHPIQLMIGSIIGSKKAKIHLTKPNDSDLDLLRVLIEKEKLRPVIEKCFPLNEIVNAHRHVESGRTKGKIVLKIE